MRPAWLDTLPVEVRTSHLRFYATYLLTNSFYIKFNYTPYPKLSQYRLDV